MIHRESENLPENATLQNKRHLPTFPHEFPQIFRDNNSTNSSENTTPMRKNPLKNSRQTIVVPPPDVLNINQIKMPEKIAEIPLQNANARLMVNDESSSSNSDDSENYKSEESRNRQRSKPKLFEELRENVYKEVASLISANEGRPHFLIQLFRDLQFVSSDPLRRRTLQSIHSLVTSDYQVRSPLMCCTGAISKIYLDSFDIFLLDFE